MSTKTSASLQLTFAEKGNLFRTEFPRQLKINFRRALKLNYKTRLWLLLQRIQFYNEKDEL